MLNNEQRKIIEPSIDLFLSAVARENAVTLDAFKQFIDLLEEIIYSYIEIMKRVPPLLSAEENDKDAVAKLILDRAKINTAPGGNILPTIDPNVLNSAIIVAHNNIVGKIGSL